MGINDVNPNTLYVHFTSALDAQLIVESRELRSGNWGSAYAVIEGGAFVPRVQFTREGKADSRDYAVVFTAAETPDHVYPEECVWKSGRVVLTSAVIVAASEAVELLN